MLCGVYVKSVSIQEMLLEKNKHEDIILLHEGLNVAPVVSPDWWDAGHRVGTSLPAGTYLQMR
jgi:hypothetical protein